MARRATGGGSGDYLPQLHDGIRARIARLSAAMPGFGSHRLDLLERGKPVPMVAVDVWSALAAVDLDAAEAFRFRHGDGGPWPFEGGPLFVYHPATGLLTAADEAPPDPGTPPARTRPRKADS